MIQSCQHAPCGLTIVQRWTVSFENLEQRGKTETFHFCSHVCLFEWMRAKFGDAMQRLTFFRRGIGGPEI